MGVIEPYMGLAPPLPMSFEQYTQHLAAVQNCELSVLIDSSIQHLLNTQSHLEKVRQSMVVGGVEGGAGHEISRGSRVRQAARCCNAQCKSRLESTL